MHFINSHERIWGQFIICFLTGLIVVIITFVLNSTKLQTENKYKWLQQGFIRFGRRPHSLFEGYIIILFKLTIFSKYIVN